MNKQEMEKRTDNRPASRSEAKVKTYAPRVDIIEGEKAVTLLADMPGIDAKDVALDLNRNVLTLSGKCGLEAPEGFDRSYVEYENTNYERVFTLGNEIDRDAIEATVKNGVLKLVLPKAKEARPRKISVNAE